jgi:hypothetical protein
MDMKKLIDDTDFDNINELSKRWKKESHHTSTLGPPSENSSLHMQENTYEEKSKQTQKESGQEQVHCQKSKDVPAESRRGKREVVPQVMDEDTEHFRNRL